MKAAWTTELVLGHPRLCKGAPSQKTTTNSEIGCLSLLGGQVEGRVS